MMRFGRYGKARSVKAWLGLAGEARFGKAW